MKEFLQLRSLDQIVVSHIPDASRSSLRGALKHFDDCFNAVKSHGCTTGASQSNLPQRNHHQHTTN